MKKLLMVKKIENNYQARLIANINIKIKTLFHPGFNLHEKLSSFLIVNFYFFNFFRMPF